ncbi:MAG: GspE/PulE/PilB domain-containing protein [Desulfobulbaceae bacterium]
MTGKKRLGELLIDSKLITEGDLNKALRLQIAGTRRLGYILIHMGFIKEDQLQAMLSEQLDVPIVNVASEFDPSVKRLIPKYLCRKYSVIPLKTGDNNTLTLAMVDPSDSEAVSDIEKYTSKVIQPVLASTSEISSNIRTRIPWSLRDIFNSQTSMGITAAIAALALILIIFITVQLYQDHQLEKYGKTTTSPQSITYENLELILGFDKDNKVSLLGHGAYSTGYYSVTFNDTQSLEKFISSKKGDLSAKQLEWLSWAMTNPYAKK